MTNSRARASRAVAIAFAAMGFAMLVGCTPGGGGGGPDGDPAGGNACCAEGNIKPQAPLGGDSGVAQFILGRVQAATVVQPPSGTNLGLSDLRIRTDQGDFPIGSDGRSIPLVNRSGVFLVTVVNANGDAVLLGSVTTAGNRPAINARSTGVVLLYYALGGWSVSGVDLYTVLVSLEFSDTTIIDTLEAAIAAAIVRNPTALASGDAAIKDAVNAAVAAFEAAAVAKIVPTQDGEPASRLRVLAGETSVAVTPSFGVRQSGAYLQESSEGISLTNTFPRRGRLYVFETGYTDPDGTHHDNTPPLQIGTATDVPPAQSPSSFGVLGALGNDSLAPVTLPGIALPPHAGAVDTAFDLLLIGPTVDLAAPSPLLVSGPYTAQSQAWINEAYSLRQDAFVADFLVPFCGLIATGNPIQIPEALKPAGIAALRQQVDGFLATKDISLNTSADVASGLLAFFEALRDDNAFRDSFMSTLVTAYGTLNARAMDGTNLESNLLTALNAFGLEACVRIGLNRRDLGGVLHALTGSKDVERWQATLSKVRLTPSPALVTPLGPAVVLSAKADVEGSLCYRWSLGAPLGSLEELGGSQQLGDSFDSGASQVKFFVASSEVNNTTLNTVSVQVYSVAAGAEDSCDTAIAQGTLVGSASAEVQGAEDNPCSDDSTFDPLWYHSGGNLTVTVTPVVAPGDIVTVTVAHSGSVPATDAKDEALGARVTLPLACSYCHSGDGRCFCTDEDLAFVRVDGSPVGAEDFEYELHGGAQIGPGDTQINCIAVVNVGFGYVNPAAGHPGPGGSHTITYRVSPDFAPCLSGEPSCQCPFTFRRSDGFDVWSVNGVYAQDRFGSTELVLFGIKADPSYDPTVGPCEQD
jgi:hypothetical protein